VTSSPEQRQPKVPAVPERITHVSPEDITQGTSAATPVVLEGPSTVEVYLHILCAQAVTTAVLLVPQVSPEVIPVLQVKPEAPHVLHTTVPILKSTEGDAVSGVMRSATEDTPPVQVTAGASVSASAKEVEGLTAEMRLPMAETTSSTAQITPVIAVARPTGTGITAEPVIPEDTPATRAEIAAAPIIPQHTDTVEVTAVPITAATRTEVTEVPGTPQDTSTTSTGITTALPATTTRSEVTEVPVIPQDVTGIPPEVEIEVSCGLSPFFVKHQPQTPAFNDYSTIFHLRDYNL